MLEAGAGLGGHFLPEKIVIISDTSWPLGGAEAMALLSAEVMADTGIEVIFLAGDDGGKCPLDRNKIDVRAFGGAPLLDRPAHNAFIDGIYNVGARRWLEAFIAEQDTPGTVYHLHNWSQIFSPALFDALKPVASRLFVSAHDFAISCPNLSFSNYQKAGAACNLKPLSLACIATHCDRRDYSQKLWRVGRSMALKAAIDFSRSRTLVGIIHPFMSEWYERGGIPKDRIRVVRNPVNPFSKTRIKAEANKDIFFIGRLVHEKGPDLAAEAARMAGRHLRVIGDGEMRAAMVEKYPEMTYEGWRNHAQISELLKSARCVVVPSRLPETFTLVAHEALRAGIPVVAFSDVDGVEMAALGGAIVVPPRKAESLAEALKTLDDDKVVARMSQIAFDEGWRFSNTNATWRDSLLGFYSELLQQDVASKEQSPVTDHRPVSRARYVMPGAIYAASVWSDTVSL
jgi:glycosyltransferase involved in cell wall biosynthesis